MDTAWQMSGPIDAIIFDCDGTLSRIEGIDALAVQNGVGDQVRALTSQAMSATGVTPILYSERLSLVKPTRDQLIALGNTYIQERVPDVDAVIATFQRLGKPVFIISAGLKLAVDIFAQHFNIPDSQVFAVELFFDEGGGCLEFDHSSALTTPGGKSVLVQELKQKYPKMMHVGDGMNDLDVKNVVTRFVGYGGAYFRESVLANSDFYIQTDSLSPVLALALTEEEVSRLSPFEYRFFEKGLALIENEEVAVDAGVAS